MLLSEIVRDLEFEQLGGSLDIHITGIAFDSREVQDGGLFVAISGFATDGHRFVEQAVAAGARAIVVEKEMDVRSGVTVLKVQNSRQALALMAANFYGRPTGQLHLIGITGTNGKTSISYFIQSIFEQAHRPIGVIGTIGTAIGDTIRKNRNTTPESLILQQIFTEMTEAGMMNCVMEVSSHALSLHRVDYCEFDMSIFTNLTPDHLELHHTMDHYFDAKARLFEMTKGFNIINADDPYGSRLIERAAQYQAEVITYGISQQADVWAENIELTEQYTTYTAHTPQGSVQVKVHLPGLIYVYNSLAAIACASVSGISLEDIRAGIESVRNIKGRMEVVYQDEDYRVVVDFAHTEDSLEKAITTLRPFTKGRLIVVFGVYAAPGLSGLGKRQGMGRVAAKFADFAVVTSDNPKDQDPQAIIADVVAAVEEEGGAYVAIVDRGEAIRHAVEISRPGDCILIAGKGHETTQIIGSEEIPFHEAELVRELFSQLK